MPCTIRPATIADSYTVYQILGIASFDLSRRRNVIGFTGDYDPQAMAKLWERHRPLFEHLARTAEQFWIAEADGRALGYSRSILRDGLRQLTELFVLPDKQSAGVGRELMARAFPQPRARHSLLITTLDTRGQALYLKAGVYPRFPAAYFSRRPEARQVPTDLVFQPASATPEALEAIAAIDLAVLGHRRDVDHEWLQTDRQGYLYQRAGQVVGYGYLGFNNGPFALLNGSDYPAVLAHAETAAAQRGEAEFAVDIPLINRAAVDHLLACGFQLDPHFSFVMMDEPLGKFENYLFTSPPFLL